MNLESLCGMVTLVIVDFQKDFYAPDAPLSVAGADAAAENIRKLLESDAVEQVLFTVDWHPAGHCSFKENGGIWPRHCVQYSEGASLHSGLLEAVIGKGIPYQVVRKGELPGEEEYGAFSRIEKGEREGGGFELRTSGDGCLIPEGAQIAVCGLAGDFCVLETLRNLHPLKPEVFLDGTASIDGGKALRSYVEEQKVPVLGF